MKRENPLHSKKAFFQIAKILWHLDIFRRSFRELSGHTCLQDSCIFCALKDLFSQLQFSQESALPPNALRRILTDRFPDQQRFQLGLMDDAAECYENILLRIHLHIANEEPEDMCSTKHCIPHRKFAMTLVEQSVCGACGATSEPLPFTQMVHYISASALTSQIRQSLLGEKSSSDLFGQLLKYAGGMGDIRDCPSACGAKIQICRTLMNRPEIVSVGIVWDSEKPSLEHIIDVFTTIGTCLRLIDVFHCIVDSKWATSTIHNLVGLVTYSGKHYSTFFFHTKLKVWIYFDDATVKEIGPHWEQVVEKCRRGRYQPLLLLYAIPGGTPVDAENAPKILSSFQNGSSLQLSPEDNMRRSMTPSPEKPQAHDVMRRAVTPNPDSPPHVYTQRRTYNDYQNLTDMQNNIFHGQEITSHISDVDSTYISRHTVESVIQQQKNLQKQSLRSPGAINQDGISISDHLNVPRRRDSGNWSGDRNSASSSSSTTMDNPYLYIINKMQRNYVTPKSPTNKTRGTSNGSSGHYDAGYDSYSISSNDSLPLQHGLKHTLQLAQIPEAHQPSTVDDCERLCKETDALLDKSRAVEDTGDLGTAVALCDVATSKARAAMDAPYNNPHIITIARMKHNTCVMRSRSLHRRMLQEQVVGNKELEGAVFEGKLPWEINKAMQHSRQNSKDKGHHSRQNSRELVNSLILTEKPVTKNIEIYATLPKKRNLRSKLTSAHVIEDEEYILNDRTTQRTGLFTRTKKCDHDKKVKKRARSEERNKNTVKDFSIAPATTSNCLKGTKPDTLKEIVQDIRGNDKSSQDEPYSSMDRKSKKQHKIRRKLLMGGLIKRKNRSMPDLRESSDGQPVINQHASNCIRKQSIDDSIVGLRESNIAQSLSGYLSEGHLEFTGNFKIQSGNPNLERSRLMRKSCHGNADKMLQVTKVPPPPPLRTTSQLSESKCSREVRTEQQVIEMSHASTNGMYAINSMENENLIDTYWNHTNSSNSLPVTRNNNNYSHSSEPQSLPSFPFFNEQDEKSPSILNQQIFNTKANIKDDVIKYANGNLHELTLVVTHADIHNEQRPDKSPVEILPPYPVNVNILSHSRQSSEEFPPPPYPMINAEMHSRQASEDFPPPPSPIEVEGIRLKSMQSVELNSFQQTDIPSGSLAQLELKGSPIRECSQLQEKGSATIRASEGADENRNEKWLKEPREKNTQKKVRRMAHLEGQEVPKSIAKRTSDLMMNTLGQTSSQICSHDVTDYPRVLSSVRDMAAKFEKIKLQSVTNEMDSKSANILLKVDNLETTDKTHKNLPEASNYMTFKMENLPESPEANSSRGLVGGRSNSNQTSRIAVSASATQDSGSEAEVLPTSLTRPYENGLPVDYPGDDISEVAMQNTIQNTTILPNEGDIAPKKLKNGIGKKKSVSFCDQVVLVATAEDDEKDSYFPNPILERVLRSAMNKPETISVLREIQKLQEAESNKDNSSSIKFQHQTIPLKNEAYSVTSTPFQDQLRSVNPISNVAPSVKLNGTRPDPDESIGSITCIHNSKILYASHINDYINTTDRRSNLVNSQRIPHQTVHQQQIRYSQNGLASYPFYPPGSSHNHPITHPPSLRNVGKQMTLMHKPSNSSPIQQQKSYSNCQNTSYPVFDQLEQYNQSNIYLTTQTQLENASHQRIIDDNCSPNTVQQNQQLPHSFINSNSPQSSNQNHHEVSQDYPYQSNLHTISMNQQLPQYQPPPNPVSHHPATPQFQLSQQSQTPLQNIHSTPLQILQQYHQKSQNYQPKVGNCQRLPEQINEQNVLAPNQTYPNSLQNGQIQSNMKYSDYQHASMTKSSKPIHFQNNGKCQTTIFQSVPLLQKSGLTSTNSKTVPCNLCRKRTVLEAAIYCSDCDFYMSRFRPKN